MKAMSDAICEFRKDPEVGVNLHWSWRKERRGMMVRRYIESIDIPASVNEKKMIADWRTNLVNHLFLNLAAAGLKDRATGSVPEEFGDGEPPNEDDPGDDD